MKIKNKNQLKNVKPGDSVYIYDANGEHWATVSSVRRVNNTETTHWPKNAKVLELTIDVVVLARDIRFNF